MSKLWYQLERKYNQKLMDKENVLLALTIYIFHTPIQVARVSLVLNLLSQKGLPKGDKYSGKMSYHTLEHLHCTYGANLILCLAPK